MEGMLETSLMEEYYGAGSYVLCQMPLTAKALVAPAATTLLQNLLTYLAEPGAFRTPGKTALLIGTNETLRKALEESQLVYENLQADSTSCSPRRTKWPSSMWPVR